MDVSPLADRAQALPAKADLERDALRKTARRSRRTSSPKC